MSEQEYNPFDVDEELPAPRHATGTSATAMPATAATPVTTTPVTAPEPEPAAPAEAPTAAAEVNTSDVPVTVDTESSEKADQAAAERAEALTELGRYEKRRRRYATAAVAALALAGWWLHPWTSVPHNGTPQAASAAGGARNAAPMTIVNSDVAILKAKLLANDDLTNTTIAGAQVASAGTTAYVARTIAGQCTVYGLLNGKEIQPQADPTNAACTGQIAQIQAQLDAQDQQARQSQVAQTEAALQTAAQTAAFYASRNFADGTQSLTGIPADQLAGVVIVKNTGTWMQMTATVGKTCRQAIVTATGQLGEIGTCP